MKALKKINKGLILTVIVLVILIIYLVGVESRRNAEKPHIETAVKDYIELFDKYAVLPEENQKIYYEVLSDKKFEELENSEKKAITEQVSKYETEVKTKMIESNKAVEIQKEALEDFLTENNNFSQSVITKFDRNVTNLKKYVFDDDQVTVSFNSEIEIETKYFDGTEERTKKNTQKQEEDMITLKLVDGKWKVIYADLRYYPNGGTAGLFGIGI